MGTIRKGVFMKKFAAGLLTALCATTFAVAQPVDQPNGQPQAQPTSYDQFYEQATNQQAAPATDQNAAVQQTSVAATNTNTYASSKEFASGGQQPTVTNKKTPVGIGIRGDFIYGKLWGFKDLSDGYEEPTGFGSEFGLTARFGMLEGLQFSPEITFRIFNVSHEDDGVERCYNQMFLDFSFYIRGVFGGFFLEVGPQIAINTSSEYKIDGENNEFENIDQATAEFGLNFGAGYSIIKNLSIGFRWYMGFNEVFPDVKYYDELKKTDYDGSKVKSSVKWSTVNLKGAQTMMYKFGVTYWFM